MTDGCRDLVKQLRYDEKYEDMSIEAFLLLLIDCSSKSEIQYLLDNTDWDEEISLLRGEDEEV